MLERVYNGSSHRDLVSNHGYQPSVCTCSQIWKRQRSPQRLPLCTECYERRDDLVEVLSTQVPRMPSENYYSGPTADLYDPSTFPRRPTLRDGGARGEADPEETSSRSRSSYKVPGGGVGVWDELRDESEDWLQPLLPEAEGSTKQTSC